MTGSTVHSASVSKRSDARERLLAAAYDLFSHEGIQAVGIDAIIERSGRRAADHVPPLLLQAGPRARHSSSDARSCGRRTGWWPRCMRRASDPEDRLLAIFDVFDEWFRTPQLRGLLVHQRDARASRRRRIPSTEPPRRISPASATFSRGSPGRPGSLTPTASPVSGTSS